MREDRFLYFQRRDVLAAADDDLLLAIHNVDEPVLIPDRHVAGMEPGPGHYRRGHVGLAEIALHDVIAGGNHFADGLHVTRNIVHLFVDHSHHDTRDGPSGHRSATMPVGI